MKNKVRIKITAIKTDLGKSKEFIFNNVLMLRTARNVGDEETINHYVLGKLRRVAWDVIEFEQIQ